MGVLLFCRKIDLLPICHLNGYFLARLAKHVTSSFHFSINLAKKTEMSSWHKNR
jgi:hypothetical protein